MLHRIRSFLLTPEPPGLGPETRAQIQPAEPLSQNLRDVAVQAGWSERQHALVRAAILLWHDHLEAAHRIVQAIDDRDGSLIHGIMHRREPDYGNAKYWFRRAGQHPVYRPLAVAAKERLAVEGSQEAAGRLLPGDRWDALAFVDECERCAVLPQEAPPYRLARELQRLEFEALFAYLGT